MTAAREHTVDRPGGHILRVYEDGDPAGKPVFSLHGTPGSRLLYPKHVADATARGIRLIGYDRPGYGSSTTLRGRRMSNVPGDVAAIADALGIERFAVWGHSGGGSPALACAALQPKRVIAASALAAVAPLGADGFDPLTGMGESNLEDFRLMISNQPAWEVKIQKDAADIRQANAEQLQAMFTSLLSDVDLRALSPELVDFLVTQAREGLRPGADGVRDDNLSDILPWGFELSAIKVPVQLWHGGHDRFVPFQHGQWIASRLRRAEVHLDPEEGHLSLYEHRIPEVHAWLRAKFAEV